LGNRQRRDEGMNAKDLEVTAETLAGMDYLETIKAGVILLAVIAHQLKEINKNFAWPDPAVKP
jgi:hypothetical protein